MSNIEKPFDGRIMLDGQTSEERPMQYQPRSFSPAAPTGAPRQAHMKHIVAPNATPLSRFARFLLRLRSERATRIGVDFFGEPGWDIMLDLFIAQEEGRKVSVSSACLAANVPTTTALRWLRTLELEGKILRESDPKDSRRSFVRLSPRLSNDMRGLLSEMSAIGGALLASFPVDEDGLVR